MTKTSRPLYISYAGPSLLEMPLLNKGSAFTPQERVDFNLIGLLPQNVETIEEQVTRVYNQYQHATKDRIKIIVVTDSERILGLGDQGIGGMGIPIGKLSLYTACGGISPAYTLPIVLDVGTNNQELLDDPMYMGWRHKRVTGKDYEDFIALFIEAVQRRWPDVLLQFEDFAQTNAMPLLEKYRDELCCFNDDIQGTASVAVGTLLAACKAKNETLGQQ
nr:NADP-dependent malic enzyme [Tanacetum cinerariifolium]